MCDFWQIANSVFGKGKSDTPLFRDLVVLLYESDKVKLFAKNFSKNSNLGDLCVSLLAFFSRTNLKLHNVMFLKLVKKVITNFDLSNTSDPDCILLVILNNREPEI